HGPAHVDRRPVPERWHGTSISPPAHPSRRRRDMSRLWIGTSWKMTKTIAEARAWAEGLRDHLAGATDPAVQPFVIPSFTATTTVAGILGEHSPALLGVQNAHWEDAGAWTGEVSVAQAKAAGAVTEPAGPRPCTLAPARGALAGLAPEERSRVVIASEAIWAIGETGRPATVPELIDPFAALGSEYGGKVTGLLYGGSVNLDNAADLLGIEHVTGLFVGRTAWQLDGYLELRQIAQAHAEH